MTTQNQSNPRTFTVDPAIGAEGITFGVEIETTIPTGSIRVDSYYGRNRYTVPTRIAPTFEGHYWSPKTDSSIRVRSNNRVACEFVSPVLRGAAGLANVVETVRNVQALGGKVNESCGVHIHVGFPTHNKRALKRLMYLVANYEKALYASTGTARRERGGWCNSLRNLQPLADHIGRNGVRNCNVSRYHTLNLVNMSAGRFDAVEFRVFSGSLNPLKIAAWVQLCIGLVQLALNGRRCVKWTAKAPGAQYGPNAGTGERELNRLFYALGWCAGRGGVYGRLGALDGEYSNEACKRTLRGLAKKRDQAAGETAAAV